MTDHNQIVALAARIAQANDEARTLRRLAAPMFVRFSNSSLAVDYARRASSIDDDICQLCVEMRLLCREGERS